MKARSVCMLYFLIYLIFINVVAFFMYGLDKSKAKKGKWRIKESTLLIFSLLGGGIGSLIGMKIHRHKTQKAKFTIGVPLLTIVFVGVVFMLYYYRMMA